jgi:anti-sigma factor (TIGR02949 family)
LSETTCEVVLEELERYLDGEIDPEVAAEVAAHLSECRSCLHRADFQRRLLQIVGLKCRVQTPAHLWRRVMQELEADARGRWTS